MFVPLYKKHPLTVFCYRVVGEKVPLESTICPTTYLICLKRRLCQDTRRDAILRLLASLDCRVLLTEVFIVTFIVQSPLPTLNDLNHKIDDLRI